MEKLTDRQFKRETSFGGSRKLLKQWKRAYYLRGYRMGTPRQFVTDSISKMNKVMTKTFGLRGSRPSL